MRSLPAQVSKAIATAAIALLAAVSLESISLASNGARGDGKPLCDAASAGDLARVRELIAKGEDLEEEDEMTPLMWAARNDHLDVLDALINAGAKVDHRTKDNASALALAACFGRTAIAKRLFEGGAEVGGEIADSGTDFHMAAAHDDTELVALFLAHEKSVDLVAPKIGDRTPLHVAAEHGCARVVKQLLEAGASPAAKTDRGWTPLHLAAICGRERAIAVLLDPKFAADVDGADSFGATALHWAAGFGYTPVVEALLGGEHAKPNVLARDRHGWTALHYAAASAQRECAKRLADPNTCAALTDLQRTPLHLAALAGDELLVDALLAAKANPSVRDGYGATAAELLHDAQRARIARNPPIDAAAAVTPKDSPPAARVTSLDCRIRFLEWWRPGNGVATTWGMELGVWSDGALMFRDHRETKTVAMRIASVEIWRVERLVSEIAETNLFVMSEQPSSPDSQLLELTFQEHHLPVKRSWDRVSRSADDANNAPLAEHLTAARAWDLALAVAEFVVPESSWGFAAAVRTGNFRGYNASGEAALR